MGPYTGVYWLHPKVYRLTHIFTRGSLAIPGDYVNVLSNAINTITYLQYPCLDCAPSSDLVLVSWSHGLLSIEASVNTSVHAL